MQDSGCWELNLGPLKSSMCSSHWAISPFLNGATFHADTDFKLGGRFVPTTLSYFQFSHDSAKPRAIQSWGFAMAAGGGGAEAFYTIADAVSDGPGHLNSDRLFMLMALAINAFTCWQSGAQSSYSWCLLGLDETKVAWNSPPFLAGAPGLSSSLSCYFPLFNSSLLPSPFLSQYDDFSQSFEDSSLWNCVARLLHSGQSEITGTSRGLNLVACTSLSTIGESGFTVDPNSPYCVLSAKDAKWKDLGASIS